MCTSDSHTSPYLRRPIRTYERFLRERAERACGGKRVDSPAGASTRNPPRTDADDAEPRS